MTERESEGKKKRRRDNKRILGRSLDDNLLEETKKKGEGFVQRFQQRIKRAQHTHTSNKEGK